jgi:hypothetical protein
MKVPVYDYEFIPPPILSEEEFNAYQLILRYEPKKSLAPNDFFKKFPIHTPFFVALGSFLLAGLLEPLLEDTVLYFIVAIFGAAFGISFFILIFMLIFYLLSMPNYLEFMKVRKKYYEKIRISVIESSTYDEFCQKMMKMHDSGWILKNLSHWLTPNQIKYYQEDFNLFRNLGGGRL